MKKKSATPKTVKTKKIERVATGIPNFDSLVQGGFEKNSTNLVVGTSGSAKSIFALQFMIKGLQQGENCLYVTFEEKKSVFYANMYEFGWDLEEYEKKGLFTFLEYTPEKVRLMLEEGGGAIENIIVTKKISRIVIDSITSFALLFDDELKKREAALGLFKMISRWNCTALLTYESDPRESNKGEARTIEFESDSITNLYYVRTGTKRTRYLEILKMRGTKHSQEIYEFIVDDNGIEISKTPYKGQISL